MYAEFYIPQMQHTTGVTVEDVVLAAAGITIKYGVECNLSLSLSLSLSPALLVWYVWLSVCMMFLLNVRNMFVCTKSIMNKRNTTNQQFQF
jgi:hypothetical protein